MSKKQTTDRLESHDGSTNRYRSMMLIIRNKNGYSNLKTIAITNDIVVDQTKEHNDVNFTHDWILRCMQIVPSIQ